MATRYVSSLATGGGSGTLASPWTPAEAATNYAAGDAVLFLADGTYSLSAGLTFSKSGSNASATLITGAKADGTIDGTKATIQAAAGSITLLTITGLYTDVRNFVFDGNGKAINFGNDSAGYSRWANCEFSNSIGAGTGLFVASVCDSLFSNNTGQVFQCQATVCEGITFSGCAGIAFHSCQTILRSVIYNHSASAASVAAVYLTGANVLVDGLSIYSPGYNGIYIASLWGEIRNSIVVGAASGQTGFVGNAFSRLINCAGYNPGATNNSGFGQVAGFQSLTAAPFANGASGNLALNSTAGGGAACRAAGIPGAFPGGLTTGYPDIGAVQHQDSGSGGGGPSVGSSPLIRIRGAA